MNLTVKNHGLNKSVKWNEITNAVCRRTGVNTLDELCPKAMGIASEYIAFRSNPEAAAQIASDKVYEYCETLLFLANSEQQRYVAGVNAEKEYAEKAKKESERKDREYRAYLSRLNSRPIYA